MTTLTSSLIVRLIDQVTGPARGVEDSLRRINRAGSGGGSGAAPSFADNMAAAQQRVGTAIEANNRAMDGARGRMVDAVAGYYILDRTIGRTVRVAGNFQEAMNRVAVVSRANEEQLGALNAQARELGRTTQFTASQVADGMGFLAMAGFNAQQVMASMPDTLNLAAAGGMELGRSADIVSNILTGYALEIEDLTRVSDILTGTFTRTNTDLDQLGTAFTYAGPMAAAAGMQFEETAAILGRMGDAGYQGSLGGTALRGALIRLLAPTSSATALMEGLDVSIEDIADNGESLEDALGEAEEAMRAIGLQVTDAEGRMLPFVDIMRQLESHAEDAGLMARLFGARAGPAMTALLRQGSDSVRELSDELSTLEGETARVAEQRMQGFNGQMRAFQSAVEGVQIAIGTALLPALTEMINKLTGLMQPVTAFLEANPQLTAAIVGTTAALIGLKIAATGLTFIGLIGKGGALSLLAGGLKAITLLGTPVAGFFETLAMRNALATRSLGSTPGILARIGDAARVLVRSVPGVGLIGKALLAIGGAVAGITAPVWGAIAAGVALVAAGGALLWKYWDRVSSVLGGVGRRIMDELQPAFEALQPVLDFISPALDLVSAAASAVGAGFGLASQAVRDFFGWIGSFFEREVLSDEDKEAWGEAGHDAADRLIDGIKEVFADLPRWVAGGWALDLFQALTGMDLYEAGAAAVETLKQAFWDFLDWVAELPGRVLSAIGTIDLSDLIRFPSAGDIRARIGNLFGGSDAPEIAPRIEPAGMAALDPATRAAAETLAASRDGPLPTPERLADLANHAEHLRSEMAEINGRLEQIGGGAAAAFQGVQIRGELQQVERELQQVEAELEEGRARADEMGAALALLSDTEVAPEISTASIDQAIERVERLVSSLRAADSHVSTLGAGGGSGGGTSGHRASGGPVWPGSSFLVGEQEPEIFTPTTGGEITPLSAIERGVMRMIPVIRDAIGRLDLGEGGGGDTSVTVFADASGADRGADIPVDMPAVRVDPADPVEVASPAVRVDPADPVEMPAQATPAPQQAPRPEPSRRAEPAAEARPERQAPNVTMHNAFNISISGADDPQAIVRQVRDRIADELSAIFRGINADAPVR